MYNDLLFVLYFSLKEFGNFLQSHLIDYSDAEITLRKITGPLSPAPSRNWKDLLF